MRRHARWQAPNSWVADKVSSLAAADNVHVMTRTTAVGHWHHNYLMLFERVADHDPALPREGAPRHRLWKVRAKQVILASGAIERPIAFANNDRPGIMLASAARAMVERYGVAPGLKVLFSPIMTMPIRRRYHLKPPASASALLIPGRAEGALAEKARAAGIDVAVSSVVSAVDGNLGVTAVRVAAYRKGQGRVITERKMPCDFIAMSGGFNPTRHLWCHNGGKLTFDERLQTFRPGKHHDAIPAVGGANGTFGWPVSLPKLRRPASFAKRKTKSAKVKRPRQSRMQKPLEALWFAPATGKYNEGNKHFIDFQNDVTAADLELAQREGYASVEHTKRYTTFGMATDQGKTSNLNGLGVLAEATGKTIPEIGVTTFRPPYTPFSFGSIAGC